VPVLLHQHDHLHLGQLVYVVLRSVPVGAVVSDRRRPERHVGGARCRQGGSGSEEHGSCLWALHFAESVWAVASGLWRWCVTAGVRCLLLPSLAMTPALHQLAASSSTGRRPAAPGPSSPAGLLCLCCSIVVLLLVWNESECLLRNETRGVSLFCYRACSPINKRNQLQGIAVNRREH
jgi:hypothetical protein